MIDYKELELPGILLIQPRIFEDARGYFFESFNEAIFRLATGLNVSFVQDNESMSQRGTVRGLHFQVPPKAQAKLIRVVQGCIMDVVVDLRKSSVTYGKSIMVELSAKNKSQLFVPEGFAHGFIVMENDTIVNYKCNNYYSPDAERCLSIFDSTLKMEWPISEQEMIISDKDRKGLDWQACSDVFF